MCDVFYAVVMSLAVNFLLVKNCVTAVNASSLLVRSRHYVY